ncbi:MAG: hypothetical protein LT102_06615, partial [Burkholderiaceae bacterium]|nr:hypothetical protein [Burkholderiaceae bacterium]
MTNTFAITLAGTFTLHTSNGTRAAGVRGRAAAARCARGAACVLAVATSSAPCSADSGSARDSGFVALSGL